MQDAPEELVLIKVRRGALVVWDAKTMDGLTVEGKVRLSRPSLQGALGVGGELASKHSKFYLVTY